VYGYLEKAGRAAGKAFQDDSHRNYMARKIDMQREQFGLVLPSDTREHEELQVQAPTKPRPEVHVAPDEVPPEPHPREEEDLEIEAPAKSRSRPEVQMSGIPTSP
jgi:hypothetical protein